MMALRLVSDLLRIRVAGVVRICWGFHGHILNRRDEIVREGARSDEGCHGTQHRCGPLAKTEERHR